MSTLSRWLDTSNQFAVRRAGLVEPILFDLGERKAAAITREQAVNLAAWLVVVAGVEEKEFAALVNQIKR